MKKIWFLSFGHWSDAPRSEGRSAADALIQSIELQADQIRLFREAWTAAGHQRQPRISVSPSIFALVNRRAAPLADHLGRVIASFRQDGA